MEHLERTKHQHAAMTAEPSDTGTSVRTRLDNRTVFLFFFFLLFSFLVSYYSWRQLGTFNIWTSTGTWESIFHIWDFLFIENFLPSSPQGCNKKEVQTVRLKKTPKIPVGDNWCHGDDYQLSLLTRAFCFGLCTCSPTNGQWMPPITLQNDH